ncbi:MAG: hypothetical protein GX621_01710 [Pirellulaceae bacterium]|nr:hypothetical protein [Pirellulaceae bacterium]
MTEQNPYAAPAPTQEEMTSRSTAMPQTLRAAVWQGVKVGFRWGSRIGLLVMALLFAVLVVAFLGAIWQGLPTPDITWLDIIPTVVVFWGFCSVVGIVAGTIISSAAYLLRKGIAAWRR